MQVMPSSAVYDYVILRSWSTQVVVVNLTTTSLGRLTLGQIYCPSSEEPILIMPGSNYEYEQHHSPLAQSELVHNL